MSKIESIVKLREIVTSIKSIDQTSWGNVMGETNIYLSYGYLKALEESMKDEMDFYYSIRTPSFYF